jgi:glycosyltransferase involved in cell wall biosynthesis
MLRILQFADVINRYDFIDAIVRYANPREFQVGVCVRTAQSNIADPAYTAAVPRWVLSGTSRREVPRAAWQLAGILRRWKVDILHTHHYDQAVIGWWATRLHPRTRMVVGRHYSDAIYRSAAGLKRKLLLGLEQAVNRAAARIVAPSAFIVEILTRWQGVDPAKVEQIPYGFVPEKYEAHRPEDVRRLRDELGLTGRFVLGNFSRLHKEKGQRFLLQAVAEIRKTRPDLTLLVVGEGPERPALERQVRESGLADAVRLLGWRRDVMALMAVVDVVVQPSLQEAFSQVMAEALWMGKPLIMTDVSGAPDVIRDGHNGLLVPRGDASALTAAVARVAGDEALRGRLAAAGRSYVADRLTASKVIPLYEHCYRRAMEA